jgi:hypothetical protein
MTIPISGLRGRIKPHIAARAPKDVRTQIERSQEHVGLFRVGALGIPRPFMRSRLLCIALTLLISSEAAALAQCDDKSQQNAADEAGIKGDLRAASQVRDAG